MTNKFLVIFLACSLLDGVNTNSAGEFLALKKKKKATKMKQENKYLILNNN